MPSSGCKTCALRSEEHTSELQSHSHLVCRLLFGKKKAPLATGHGPLARRRTRAGGSRPRRGRLLFFFNDTAPTEICTLSLHDALPISGVAVGLGVGVSTGASVGTAVGSGNS